MCIPTIYKCFGEIVSKSAYTSEQTNRMSTLRRMSIHMWTYARTALNRLIRCASRRKNCRYNKRNLYSAWTGLATREHKAAYTSKHSPRMSTPAPNEHSDVDGSTRLAEHAHVIRRLSIPQKKFELSVVELFAHPSTHPN
ncbi:hypothetical protein FQR65_LT10238 [Abscondita terminalis]|nr:hypothetical protein FQR65_LT10238 [Abscondita terminalis]